MGDKGNIDEKNGETSKEDKEEAKAEEKDATMEGDKL